VFEQVRSRLFIDPAKLDAHAAAEFQRLHTEGKIGFVPRAMLGDLAKPHLPIHNKAVTAVDAINNASRFAILYLKPAYAIPNLLGNAALNVLQQGFASVPNLGRAARLNAARPRARRPHRRRSWAKGSPGDQRARRRALAGVVDKAASVWSKGVDTPFRRSSFLYEARRAGYDTPQKLERLLTDRRTRTKLVEITQRANREIIDYANLTPTEREVVRRVVFFYPWVKGSTVYAGRLLREHPVKAAVIGQVGQTGKEQSDQLLGPVPSYLEGVFPVGDHELVNPASAAILQTPAQVGKALAGLAGGDVGKVGELSNFLSPASALAIAAITRRDRGGYPYPAGTGSAASRFDQLVKNTAVHARPADRDASRQGQTGCIRRTSATRSCSTSSAASRPASSTRRKLAELAGNERSRYLG
jgi:hypothetical protein